MELYKGKIIVCKEDLMNGPKKHDLVKVRGIRLIPMSKEQFISLEEFAPFTYFGSSAFRDIDQDFAEEIIESLKK